MLKKITTSIVLVILVNACGGGSSSSKTSNDNTSVENALPQEFISLEKRAIIESGYVMIDGKKRELNYVGKLKSASGLLAFSNDSNLSMIRMSTFDGKTPDYTRMVVRAIDNNDTFNCVNITKEVKKSEVIKDHSIVIVKGRLCRGHGDNIGQRKDIEIKLTDSMLNQGASRLEIKSDKAYLSSSYKLNNSQDIQSFPATKAYNQIFDMIENHPEVRTIVFDKVIGDSLNEEMTKNIGRLIRRAGLNTKIESKGIISHSGVELFSAGISRSMDNNATIAVKSWQYNTGTLASNLPTDDPQHKSYINYYNEMLGSELGERFYRFSLKKQLHIMSEKEIVEYGLLTE